MNRIEEQLPAAAAGKFLTFQQTENEIINIVGRLHDLRLASNPDIFERLWAAHIGRVEEVEASIREGDIIPIGEDMDEEGKPLDVNTPEIEERGSDEDAVMKDNFELFPGTSIPAAPKRGKVAATISNAAAVPFPTQLVSDAAIRQRSYPNYSSEPFNSAGNPKALSLTQQHYLRPQLPGVMSIWIMTSPPHVSYRNRAYHHPAAPVQEQEMVAFFTQVMERAEHVREKDVKGYALGYGWCDVSRWIEKTVGQGCRGLGDGVKAGESEGERLGWEVFQKDLLDAVTKGVMVWRMKVLVVKK